jgi:hypothetical protein
VSRLRRSGILIRLPTALPWANLRVRLRRLERRGARGGIALKMHPSFTRENAGEWKNGWAVSRLRRSGILIRLPTALLWANLRARLRRLERRRRERHGPGYEPRQKMNDSGERLCQDVLFRD